MIKIKKNSIVYVLCPAYTKTGGPELLHQLVESLNNNKINAKITYYNYNEDKEYTNSDFKKYVSGYELIDNIADDESNVVIIPETNVELMKRFKNIKTVIWWLSVDNYELVNVYKKIKEVKGLKAALKCKIRSFIKGNNEKLIFKADYHLCQSYYAIDFLEKKGIKDSIYLSDYINDSYLETKVDYSKKQDIVLYNPKKGYIFTKKIMAKAPELTWIPIQNMTTSQVHELLLKAKVYIDFGNHPGKDRFPRETAVCGCCVITGKRGAAKFEKDVPISGEFKFEDIDSNIDIIVEKIKECLKKYNTKIKKYKKYREFILSEKKKFNDDVKKIFVIKN